MIKKTTLFSLLIVFALAFASTSFAAAGDQTGGTKANRAGNSITQNQMDMRGNDQIGTTNRGDGNVGGTDRFGDLEMNRNDGNMRGYNNGGFRAANTMNNNNWSWLGLLGLIGLAGLFGRNREGEAGR